MAVVVVLALGVGLGAGAPVVSICPASTETASARLSVMVAHVWRKVFIFFAPERVCKIFASANQTSMIGLRLPCKARRTTLDCVSLSFLACNLKTVFMTLRASLLRELENSSISVDRHAEVCCELARDFENTGEYEAARRALRDYWRCIGEQPKLSGLEEITAAKVLLRAGVLTGYIGSKNQIEDAQENAKDLITQSQTIFAARGSKKQIAEAHTELALIYWRTGENNEARDLLHEALSLLSIDSDLKAKAVIRLAVVEFRAARHEKALRILRRHKRLFDKIQNHTLKGSYHDTLGNALEDL